MERAEVYSRLAEVFRDVFDREVALADETTAADVPGWDSLNHITLIGTVEDENYVAAKLFNHIVNLFIIRDIFGI